MDANVPIYRVTIYSRYRAAMTATKTKGTVEATEVQRGKRRREREKERERERKRERERGMNGREALWTAVSSSSTTCSQFACVCETHSVERKRWSQEKLNPR